MAPSRSAYEHVPAVKKRAARGSRKLDATARQRGCLLAKGEQLGRALQGVTIISPGRQDRADGRDFLLSVC